MASEKPIAGQKCYILHYDRNRMDKNGQCQKTITEATVEKVTYKYIHVVEHKQSRRFYADGIYAYKGEWHEDTLFMSMEAMDEYFERRRLVGLIRKFKWDAWVDIVSMDDYKTIIGILEKYANSKDDTSKRGK